MNAPFSDDLLAWYGDNARTLPWRVSPTDRDAGIRPDPYRVWVSEIMLQQTTVAHAAPYFMRFMALWPDVQSLARAQDTQIMSEWAGLGYYARARNLVKGAHVLASIPDFPREVSALKKVPGIGPYTAGAIAAIAFDQVEAAIDTNVERIISRLFDIKTPIKSAKKSIATHAQGLIPDKNSGAFAEAMMDLGATICIPKIPDCENCPVSRHCASYKHGTQSQRPVIPVRSMRPTRYGRTYIYLNRDEAGTLKFCAVKRPAKGLLGGMMGLPTSDWVDKKSALANQMMPPFDTDWIELGSYKHAFTHFNLCMEVLWAQTASLTLPKEVFGNPAFWLQLGNMKNMPTAFKKAIDMLLAQGKLDI